MKFYQQLQLNQAGSKKLIRQTEQKGLKLQRILIYILKVILTVAFCFFVVSAFSLIFGNNNSIVGVVVLLFILVMRKAHLGINTSHSILILFSIFAILAIGPHLANMLSPLGAFAVNLFCIFTIVLIGCHEIQMSNQSTFVLSYLLLYGYDVSGHAFTLRIYGIILGAILTAVVFYINHRRTEFECTGSDIFRQFSLTSERNMWQMRFSLIVCTLMLILDIMGFHRIMWAGIAAMSILTPFPNNSHARLKWRAPGNIIGCVLFVLMFLFLPDNVFAMIGVFSGICIGFSAQYSWQTIFNSLGALYIASGLFGVPTAIFLRIFHNTVGSLFSALSDKALRVLSNKFLQVQ